MIDRKDGWVRLDDILGEYVEAMIAGRPPPEEPPEKAAIRARLLAEDRRREWAERDEGGERW